MALRRGVCFHEAGGRDLATNVTGRCVATGAVPAKEQDTYQQDQDDHDDPGRFHPARRPGIGRPVTHVRLLSSRPVVEAIIRGAASLRYIMSRCQTYCISSVVVYTGKVPRLWDETIEAHRAAVREAILDTTGALVAEHGLLSVTMSRVAGKPASGARRSTSISRTSNRSCSPGTNVTSAATSNVSPGSGTGLATLASGSRPCSGPTH